MLVYELETNTLGFLATTGYHKSAGHAGTWTRSGTLGEVWGEGSLDPKLEVWAWQCFALVSHLLLLTLLSGAKSSLLVPFSSSVQPSSSHLSLTPHHTLYSYWDGFCCLRLNRGPSWALRGVAGGQLLRLARHLYAIHSVPTSQGFVISVKNSSLWFSQHVCQVLISCIPKRAFPLLMPLPYDALYQKST